MTPLPTVPTETREVKAAPRSVVVMRPLVGDGCERHYVYEPSRPNEAAGLAVTLRPVLGDDAANWFNGDPTTQLSRAALLWEKHGVGWNMATPGPTPDAPPVPAAVTAVNFLRLLPYPAQLWLADVLLGYGTATSPGTPGEPATEQGRTEKN